MSRIWKWGRRFLVALALSLCVLWALFQAECWVFRRQAEQLLVDVQHLQVGMRTDDPEFERFLHRWKKWGSHDSCPREVCDDWILARSPGVVRLLDRFSKDGTHDGSSLLNRLGIRVSLVRARIFVRNGVVAFKVFGVGISYPTLRDDPERIEVISSTSGTLGAANLNRIASLHPNRRLDSHHGDLDVIVTPEESPDEQRALTDFQLSCLTRWARCTQADLLPKAAAEYQAERWADEHPTAQNSSRAGLPICVASADFLGREAMNIFQGKVLQASLVPPLEEDEGQSLQRWTITVQPSRAMKGRFPSPFERIVTLEVQLPFQPGARETVRFPWSDVLLVGDISQAGKTPKFEADECGVLPSTKENVAASLRGIAEDLNPIPQVPCSSLQETPGSVKLENCY